MGHLNLYSCPETFLNWPLFASFQKLFDLKWSKNRNRLEIGSNRLKTGFFPGLKRLRHVPHSFLNGNLSWNLYSCPETFWNWLKLASFDKVWKSLLNLSWNLYSCPETLRNWLKLASFDKVWKSLLNLYSCPETFWNWLKLASFDKVWKWVTSISIVALKLS